MGEKGGWTIEVKGGGVDHGLQESDFPGLGGDDDFYDNFDISEAEMQKRLKDFQKSQPSENPQKQQQSSKNAPIESMICETKEQVSNSYDSPVLKDLPMDMNIPTQEDGQNFDLETNEKEVDLVQVIASEENVATL